MIWLYVAGVSAGFIDSIIGGGGLISLPALMLTIGISPFAIGTNKVAATACTWTAAAVYSAHGRIPWKRAIPFSILVGAGSIAGAWISPRLAAFYRPMLIAGSLICLATVLMKDRIIRITAGEEKYLNEWSIDPAVAVAGLLCGFYDGAWGPGGGTFMFLALAYTSPMALLPIIGASKVANSASAVMSLGTYAIHGWVHWRLGLMFAASLMAGAIAGANVGVRHAERVVSPLLILISALLLIKLLQ